MKNNSKSKAIIISALSVVLVAAIVCGAIFIPKLIKKDDTKDDGAAVVSSTKVVENKAPSDGSTPQAETFEAALDAVFETGDVTFEMADGRIVVVISSELGQDLADSSFLLEISVLGQVTSYALEDSKITVNKPGRSEKVYEIEEFAEMEDWNEVLNELGIDASMVDILDEIIKDGQLSRETVAKIYDSEIRPALETAIEDETGLDVTIPTFEDSIDYIINFLNTGISEKALSFKTADDNNGAVTYKASFDSEQLVADFFTYCKADASLNTLLDAIADIVMGGTQDEMLEDLTELASKVPGGEISATLVNGELTSLVVAPKGYDTYTFTVGSAKA